RLITTVRRLLEADVAVVMLRGAPEEDFVVVATSGGGAGTSGIAADVLGRWCDGIAAGAVVMPGAEVAPALPELAGCESAWLLALQTGGALGGVVVAGTGGTVDGSEKRLLAHGIAQIASTALANARLLQELQRASRLKSEFVSTMSHELRTPLNVILGNAEMAADDDVGAAERRRCLAGIQRAGRDLLELVEDTLEIGRLDSGRSSATPVEIGLPVLWRDLWTSCAGLSPAAGVELSWGAEPPDLTVATDVRKLVTITKNLVGNALKFTARGSVAVELAPADGGLVLRVSDTGIGIPPDKHAEVFEMFRQLDGSDSRAYRGSGLGLYIVSRLAAELGGSVELVSAVGRGSTFTVTLPDLRLDPGEARPDATVEAVRSRAIA
ncbi:HAMP domain-containing histidine kinase, partial [Candidatus Binatia bacterium]|nr:HAMP domain-containing histidine kinase [Candidatus Binatia bacterium]